MSNLFTNYCKNKDIQHVVITAGLPRANCHIERLKTVIIFVLSKLSIDNPPKRYHQVHAAQQIMNSTFHHSTNTSPFELMFGTKI